jgi:2-succinyl-5-enolpyruvyl-6-hydroxy-3-cyclohexene-1-carboxylate synthase
MANQWKWPLISDICSQTRFASPQSKQVISFADNYLRFEEVAESLEPDVVLQFGRTPISKFITGYSARASNAYVVVAPGTRRIDPHHRVTDRVSLDYSAAVSSLRQIKPQSSQLLPRLQEFEQMARELIDEWYANSADVFLGSNVVSEVCSAGESARAIYLSTSMPIREANGFARGRNTEIRVCANRGVNGIDGTIAAAVGYARATQRHTTLVIGDLAVLHDLNSLALVRGSNIPLTIVILNNDGGEIFSYLPIAKIGAHFEEFFRTPHQLGFAHAADMFGVKFYQPLNLRDFSTIYRHTLRSDRSVIIEVRIDRDRNVIQHREFWESLHDRALKCTQSRDDLA